MNPNFNWTPGMKLEMIEKWAILQAFRFYRGNKTSTAQALGIAIRTLDNKLDKYKEDDELLKVVDDERRQEREDFALRQRGITRNQQGCAVFPQNQANGNGASSGLRMESFANASEEHSMPMPKRKEVQGLPSEHASHSGPKKGR
jgi:hypothetical protein